MPRLIIVTSANDTNDIPSKDELLKFSHKIYISPEDEDMEQINDIEELSFLDFYNGGFDSGVITGKNEIREFVETYSNRNEITLQPLGLDDFDKLLEENGCV